MRQPLFLFILFAFFLCPALQAQQNDAALPLPSGCVSGTLPNGMRYILHPNPLPEKKIEFRLVMAVGSQWEKDNERGMSHFLEHMAFTGSKSFPGRSVITTMQEMGIKYGYDLNAFTGYDRTIYELPTPTDRKENVGIALDILHSWLTELQLHPKEILKEQKIVCQEIKDAQITDPFDALKKRDSPHANASVLGTEKEVMTIDSVSLRDYYDRWYRPERTTLIAVGDINVAALTTAIEERFGSVTARKTINRPVTETVSLPHNGGMVSGQNTDSLISSNRLELLFPVTAKYEKKYEDLIETAKNDLFQLMLNQRLAADTLLSCHYSRTWYLADTDHAGFDVTANSSLTMGQQVEELAALLQQLHRFGFSEQELAAGKQKLLQRSKGSSSGVKDSRAYCEDYIAMTLTGEMPVTPEVRHHFYTQVLPGIGVKEISELTSNFLASEQRIIACYHCLPTDSNGTNTEDFLVAWKTGLKRNVEPYKLNLGRIEKNEKIEEEAIPSGLTIDTLQPAHIVAQKEYPSINLTEYKLSNGLRVAMRPVNSGDSTILISLFGTGGFAMLPTGAYPLLEGTASYIDEGEINGLSSDQVSEFMYQHELSLSTNISNYYHELYGAAFNGDLESLLQLLYLKVSATSIPEDLVKQEVERLSQQDSTPTLLQKQLNASLTKELEDYLNDYSGAIHRERRSLQQEELSHLSADTVIHFYRQLFNNPGQLTAIITGKFDKEKTLPVLVRYLGALPAASLSVSPVRSITNHFPAGAVRKTIRHPDAIRSSATLVFHGAYTHSLKQSLVFKMMRDVIQGRILDTLREKEGKTYSPYANVTYTVTPSPHYAFLLSYECDDKDLLYLEQCLLAELKQLQQHLISHKELEHMKQSFRINKREHLNETNTAEWRNKLKEIYLECGAIEDFSLYEEILESITSTDILNGFKAFISFDQYTLFTIQK